MSAPQPPRRPRLGGLKPWTDAELDALSEITPADIERAKASVAKETRRLLDAVDVTEDDDATEQ
jgi:hypothetical protein